MKKNYKAERYNEYDTLLEFMYNYILVFAQEDPTEDEVTSEDVDAEEESKVNILNIFCHVSGIFNIDMLNLNCFFHKVICKKIYKTMI